MNKTEIAEEGRKHFTEEQLASAFDVISFIYTCHIDATKCKGPGKCTVADAMDASMKAILGFAEVCYPGCKARFQEKANADAIELLKDKFAVERVLSIMPVSPEAKERFRKEAEKAVAKAEAAKAAPKLEEPHLVPPTKTVH